jgi:Protein of unknown function (DUF2959)
MKKLILLPAFIAALSGCQNPARKVVYSAYEMVGVQKRDLLKKRVDETRENQKEAGETFKDALDRLRTLYKIDGGKLEKQYDLTRDAYEKSKTQSEAVKGSVRQVEQVAQDLFAEWEKEASQIETSTLRAKSREQLAETQKRYADLHASLKKAEARMDPVLVKFHDQVLFLKHNLNAQAISSLKGESVRIEKDVERLIKEMEASIAEAEKFMKGM